MEAWAIVVAAGRGLRFGNSKQYALLGGRRIVDLAVDTARSVCAGVVVVLPPEDAGAVEVPGADAVVAGGATRSASVRAGLAAVPESISIVAVHDAARPLARASTWTAVITAVVQGADAAIPVVPVTDTLKRVKDSQVVSTVDRDELVVVQTPQAFRASVLRQAHASGTDATDDAGLVEALGHRVAVVAGAADNLKITCPADLFVAEALLGVRGEQ